MLNAHEIDAVTATLTEYLHLKGKTEEIVTEKNRVLLFRERLIGGN